MKKQKQIRNFIFENKWLKRKETTSLLADVTDPVEGDRCMLALAAAISAAICGGTSIGRGAPAIGDGELVAFICICWGAFTVITKNKYKNIYLIYLFIYIYIDRFKCGLKYKYSVLKTKTDKLS